MACRECGSGCPPSQDLCDQCNTASESELVVPPDVIALMEELQAMPVKFSARYCGVYHLGRCLAGEHGAG
jgi:hypothetical protein